MVSTSSLDELMEDHILSKSSATRRLHFSIATALRCREGRYSFPHIIVLLKRAQYQ